MGNEIVRVSEQFDNLNVQGKIFSIDFISNVTLDQIKGHREVSKDFEYRFDLDKYGLAFWDMKNLLNNHIHIIDERRITLTLLISKVYRPEGEILIDKKRTTVITVVPYRALSLFEGLKKEYGLT